MAASRKKEGVSDATKIVIVSTTIEGDEECGGTITIDDVVCRKQFCLTENFLRLGHTHIGEKYFDVCIKGNEFRDVVQDCLLNEKFVFAIANIRFRWKVKSYIRALFNEPNQAMSISEFLTKARLFSDHREYISSEIESYLTYIVNKKMNCGSVPFMMVCGELAKLIISGCESLVDDCISSLEKTGGGNRTIFGSGKTASLLRKEKKQAVQFYAEMMVVMTSLSLFRWHRDSPPEYEKAIGEVSQPPIDYSALVEEYSSTFLASQTYVRLSRWLGFVTESDTRIRREVEASLTLQFQTGDVPEYMRNITAGTIRDALQFASAIKRSEGFVNSLHQAVLSAVQTKSVCSLKLRDFLKVLRNSEIFEGHKSIFTGKFKFVRSEAEIIEMCTARTREFVDSSETHYPSDFEVMISERSRDMILHDLANYAGV